MGKHGVKDAKRVQLPYLCYQGGETLTNPDNFQVPLPTSITVVWLETEDDECFYAIDAASATPTSPGRLASDTGIQLGPIGGGSLQNLWVHAPSAIVHVQYFHECGHIRNERADMPRRFFVDATGGDDSNSGRTPWEAWQTMGKVNGETFLAGDEILFKRGETWTGTALVPPSSGSDFGGYITFGAYASGAKPVIDGNDAVNCAATSGADYIRFQDMDFSQGLDFGLSINGSNNVICVDCDAHDCGNAGIGVNGGSYDITIQGADCYSQYRRLAGATAAGIVIEDGPYDVTVTDCICRDGAANTQGFSIHNHAASIYPYNITVRGCTIYNNSSNGIYMQKADATVDTDRNILFEDCLVYDNDNYEMYIFLSGAAYIDGVTFSECQFRYPNGNRVIYCRADNLYFHNCEIISDSARGIYASGCQDFTMYNCTFYGTAAMAGDYLIVVDNARTSNFVLENCIMRAEQAAVNMISVVAGTGTTGMNIDYNLWGHTGGATRWWWLGAAYSWANWPANSSQDANSPSPADPSFTNPATDDYTLQAGSPAIDEGVDVGLSYCGDAPDCGAYERCT